MSVDRQVQALLDQMAAANMPDISTLSVVEARATAASIEQMLPPGPDVARVVDHMVEVEGGQILVRLYMPEAEVRGLMVYYHGGGWVTGSVQSSDGPNRILANRTRCVVAAVEYRLAPEFRFPVAVNDCYAALLWAAQHSMAIAGPGLPLIVAGDSAGGNLAGAVTMVARDLRGPKIALQILLYPVTNAAFDTPSYREFAKDKLLTRDAMVWFWNHYIPDATRRADPRASLLLAKDLSGLPPTLVQTAEFDPLRDEGEAYAAQLAAAGVPVQMQRIEGIMHGYIALAQILDGGRAAVDRVTEFIEQSL
jgi:acetyl esterase